MLADGAAVADHRVAVHAEAPGGGPHAVAVGQVADQVDGLVLGQTRAEQGRPLPLGEASLAGAAVEQPMWPGLAIAAADGQFADPPPAVVGAIRLLATEAG
jgi:hypothetical protein